ncbi:MAG TPA: hypothetical protein VHE57_10430 [Mycobacteriales bacterium]|nr:hypothetical protein [Mycobacteriales bacterium]
MTKASYEDDQVACTDTELVIKRYYPPGTPKHVAYRAIKNVTRLDLTGINAVRRWRLWGSGDLIHWWNLDLKRPGKSVALVLDVGKKVRPTITPDDPDAVERILGDHR